MQINLRGKKVAIEKLKKAAKTPGHGGLIIPDSEEYLGHIRFVGESVSTDLKVGQKVYFGKNFQIFRMAGIDLCVMDDDQVLASVQE